MPHLIRITIIAPKQANVSSVDLITYDNVQYALNNWLREQELGSLRDWKKTSASSAQSNVLHLHPPIKSGDFPDALLIESFRLVSCPIRIRV